MWCKKNTSVVAILYLSKYRYLKRREDYEILIILTYVLLEWSIKFEVE